MARTGDDETVEEIEGNFKSLISELKKLRRELSRVKKSKVRDRVIAIGFAVISLLVMRANYVSHNNNENNVKAIKSQAIAGVVSNCAFTNVQSTSITEMVTDLERTGLIKHPGMKDWADRQRSRFQKVDCVGLVSEEGDKLNICLLYPPETDPDTGQPITTTTTPETKAACEEAARNTRDAARQAEEERQSQIRDKRK
jgi:hypothetical protein